MSKKKKSLETLMYNGKQVYIHHEGEDVYLVSFNKKGKKKFSIKKDKDGDV